VERAIQLVGIESPGLTAAPAIAGHVGELVGEVLDG
jgi:L-2-hydroxyglutarate oxidase LhgO